MQLLQSFTKHPNQVNETYTQHALFAWKFGLNCGKAAVKAFLHGALPMIYPTGASDLVRKLHSSLDDRKNHCVYEVALTINKEAEAAYLAWLPKHIEDVLAAKGFLKANIYKDDAGRVVIHYCVSSAAALENYLRDRAPALREEAARKFPDQFRAERRVFKTI